MSHAEDPAFDHKSFLKHLTSRPGVYQMIDAKGNVLYVGKAQNLKNRVSQYFQRNLTSARIEHFVRQIHDIKIIITDSDNEALLLENNLIKQLKPRYNILFRDDKSYPYIFLSAHSDYPRIDFHRGKQSQKGDYYGPYPSGGAVRESLNLIQKLFRIRTCSDSFFRNRSRPCIQYQINRCSAPCVKLISPEDYQKQVSLAKLFFSGKNQELIKHLIDQMQQASDEYSYERAAILRDQISNLRKVQEKQTIMDVGNQAIDVVASQVQHQRICIQFLIFRQGRLIGSRSYFPNNPSDLDAKTALEAFLPQYYLSVQHKQDIPKQIVISHAIDDLTWLSQSLSEQAGHKVEIVHNVRSTKKGWLEMAITNAQKALQIKLADLANHESRWSALQLALNLDEPPNRMECFDVSHTMGEATVTSCVVFNAHGPDTQSYRRFNIKGITEGDDYAAMRQALMRRYQRLIKEQKALPDIVIIDGGKGQLRQAIEVFEELQWLDVRILAIAKGPSRKAGLETIFLHQGDSTKVIHPSQAALALLQHIRDEAHRFAITGHKSRREKSRRQSVLQQIPGVGAKRRQALINYFGGYQEIKRASLAEIAKAPGISDSLAKRIYNALHEQ